MIRALLLALVLAAVLCSVACASAFPPGAFDSGRGATPLPAGATRVQVGGGAGAAPFVIAAGASGGARVEHQLLDDLSLGADVSGGAETIAGLDVMVPLAASASVQWNPLGIQWLALRLRVGGGLDVPIPVEASTLADPNSDAATNLDVFFPSPFAAAQGQVVLSMDVGNGVEGYLAPGFGVKQFFGDRTDAARRLTKPGGKGAVDTALTPGLTAGLCADLSNNLSFYVSATAEPTIVLGVETTSATGTGPSLIAVSPSGNVQTGLALTF